MQPCQPKMYKLQKWAKRKKSQLKIQIMQAAKQLTWKNETKKFETILCVNPMKRVKKTHLRSSTCSKSFENDIHDTLTCQHIATNNCCWFGWIYQTAFWYYHLDRSKTALFIKSELNWIGWWERIQNRSIHGCLALAAKIVGGNSFSSFIYDLQSTQNLQNNTKGTMKIHSNPVAITENKCH